MTSIECTEKQKMTKPEKCYKIEENFYRGGKNSMSIYDSLNPMQKEAVCCTEGPLLILAGAGSGKTTVLINRIANLLLEKESSA